MIGFKSDESFHLVSVMMFSEQIYIESDQPVKKRARNPKNLKKLAFQRSPTLENPWACVPCPWRAGRSAGVVFA